MLLQPAAAVLSKREEMLGTGFQAPLSAEGCSPQASGHTWHPLPSPARRGLAHRWPRLSVPFSWSPSLGPLLSPATGKGKAGEWEEEAAALRLSS